MYIENIPIENRIGTYVAGIVRLALEEDELLKHNEKEEINNAIKLLSYLVGVNDMLLELYNINPSKVDEFVRTNRAQYLLIELIEKRTYSALEMNPYSPPDVKLLNHIFLNTKEDLEGISNKLRNFLEESKNELKRLHQEMYI
ncbi:MAG: hypothetical protein QXI09_00360 [Candidatus Aenigmatarchaeota archaeon]